MNNEGPIMRLCLHNNPLWRFAGGPATRQTNEQKGSNYYKLYKFRVSSLHDCYTMKVFYLLIKQIMMAMLLGPNTHLAWPNWHEKTTWHSGQCGNRSNSHDESQSSFSLSVITIRPTTDNRTVGCSMKLRTFLPLTTWTEHGLDFYFFLGSFV